jgi:hypothetical protein
MYITTTFCKNLFDSQLIYLDCNRVFFVSQFKKQTGDVAVTQPENKRGLGTDIAVVGSMLFLAQIIVSVSIGAIVKAVGTTKVLLWVSNRIGLTKSCSIRKLSISFSGSQRLQLISKYFRYKSCLHGFVNQFKTSS